MAFSFYGIAGSCFSVDSPSIQSATTFFLLNLCSVKYSYKTVLACDSYDRIMPQINNMCGGLALSWFIVLILYYNILCSPYCEATFELYKWANCCVHLHQSAWQQADGQQGKQGKQTICFMKYTQRLKTNNCCTRMERILSPRQRLLLLRRLTKCKLDVWCKCIKRVYISVMSAQ